MATAAIPANVLGTLATKFRTCPATGLKVDLAAERLIKANAVAAVIFLAIGGTFGLWVALFVALTTLLPVARLNREAA